MVAPHSAMVGLPGHIHPDVKESFGHPLPKKYDNLLHLFTSMEKVVSIAHGRNMRITFDSVSKNVMKNTKMTFTESHLAQIIGLYQKSYKMRWEKRRQPVGKALGTSAGFDLILTPNLHDDLHPFYDCEISNVENSFEHKSPIKTIRASPFSTKPTKCAVKPVKASTKEEIPKATTTTSKHKEVDDEANRILSRTNLTSIGLQKSPTKQPQHKGSEESSPSKRVAVQPLHLASPPKTPKTPNTPMRKLTFKESSVKIEPDFQLPPLKNSTNNNEESSNFVGGGLVSPIKLISPIKKRTERDFVRKSPMKAPAVPLPRPAQLDPAPKMEGWRRTARKMIFRHFLVLKVKEAQTIFLSTMKITLSPSKLLHPEFEIDAIEDLPAGKLPAIPESNTPLRSAYDYFKSVKPEEAPKLNESPPPSAKIPPISTSKSDGQPSKTPKVSLLERLRAREAAKKSVDVEKISSLQKQCTMLELLRKSMVEVICGHFTLDKVHSMNLRKLMSLVFLVCGKLDKETFMDHIDVLCAVAPNFCRKETLRNEAYLKISEVRVDKIQSCVEDALVKAKRELRLENA